MGDILQHRLIEAQIGYQFLELRILLLQLLQLPYLAWLQASVLFLSTVERLLSYPKLAHDVGHWSAHFMLFDSRHNLFNRIPFPLHGKISSLHQYLARNSLSK